MYRHKESKRLTNIVDVLHFINNQVWKLLFNKPAAGLEQSSDDENEYWIRDDEPVTNKYIWSRDGVNWAAFIAGIIEGLLWAIDFPAKVSAHFIDSESSDDSTVYVIKFTEEALDHEAKFTCNT